MLACSLHEETYSSQQGSSKNVSNHSHARALVATVGHVRKCIVRGVPDIEQRSRCRKKMHIQFRIKSRRQCSLGCRCTAHASSLRFHLRSVIGVLR